MPFKGSPPMLSNRSRGVSPRRRSQVSFATLIEHLERRAVLSASMGFESTVASMMWEGREVEVVRDSWVMRMPQTNRATAASPLDYLWQHPSAPAGWTLEPFGYGFYGVTAPGASVSEVSAWHQQINATSWQPNTISHSAATPRSAPQSSVVPNDPLYGDLWGLSKIDVSAAWQTTAGSSDIIVGVIDSGIDYNHPDLAANMWQRPASVPSQIEIAPGVLEGLSPAERTVPIGEFGINTGVNTTSPTDPMDTQGHGTHVAGTIAASGGNGIGVIGVAPKVRVFAAKAQGRNAQDQIDPESRSFDTVGTIRAMATIANLKQNHGQNFVAVNASYGGIYPEFPLERQAIELLNAAGILFVAAAGNAGENNDVVLNHPANYPVDNIIAVGSSDPLDRLSDDFANNGSSAYGETQVDVAAPGSRILSTVPASISPTGYAEYWGTSMAAPHVAGVAGLIASVYLAQTGELPTVEIMKSAILNGADVIPTVPGVSGLTNPTTGGVVAGNRRLNAFGALQQLPVVVSVSDAEILEGDVGQTTAVQLTVTLSRAVTQPVTVSYATRDGTALASDDDYVSISGQITFAPGQTTRTVSVTVNGDEWFERDEYFDVVITGVSGIVAQTRPGTVTIVNDDPEIMRIDVLPAVAMKRTGPTVAEFVLRPFMPVREAVRIAYTTIDGTARARRDYRPNTGIIEFRPGQAEKRVQVSILGNRRQDRDKTFALGFEIVSGPDALLYNAVDGSRDPERLAVPGLILDTNSRHFSIVPDTAITDGTFGFTVQLDRPRQFGDVLPAFDGLEAMSPELLGEFGRSLRFTTQYMIGHQSVGRILRRPPATATGGFLAGVVEVGYLIDEVTGEVVAKTSDRIEVPVDEDMPIRPVAAELFSPTNAQIKPRGGKVTLRSLFSAAAVQQTTPARRPLPIFARAIR